MTRVKIFYVKFGGTRTADLLESQINSWIETYTDMHILNVSLSVVEFGTYAAVTYKMDKKSI